MKRYGIIGCGMMGHEHIANINLLDGAKVHSVYDPVPDLASAAAAKAGGATIHPTIQSLVSDTELDAIVIVSPNFRHVENLTEIARHTTRPILCEKPLYTDLSQIINRRLCGYNGRREDADNSRTSFSISTQNRRLEQIVGEYRRNVG